MDGAQTAAGTRIYIGLTGVLAEETDWKEIGEITNPGEFGKEFALVTHNPLATRATRKFKGTFNLGSLNIEAAFDGADEGQERLGEALNSDAAYNFRIRLNDGDAEASPPILPTVFLFKAKVMSSKIIVGEVNSVVGARFMLEIDGENILYTAAGPEPTP